MELKTIFGSILTVLGITGLIYSAITYANDSATTKQMMIFGILGFVFFVAGIGLIKRLK